jgi:hypothetical protein
MASSNLDLDAIVGYVDENRVELIRKTVADSPSVNLFRLVDMVKTDTKLPLLNTNAVLQDGSDCGWTPSGTTSITQRTIAPQILKAEGALCYKEFAQTFANYETEITAGRAKMPFAEKIWDSIIDSVVEQNEKMIYQGAGDGDSYEGLISILGNDVPSGNTATLATGTSAYDAVFVAYNKLPNRAIKKDTAILVSTSLYRKFIQEMVAKNYYHFKPEEGEPKEMFLPGTSVKVIGVEGLDDTATYDYLIGARIGDNGNIFYGVNAKNAEKVIDSWYEKKDDAMEYRIQFSAGVQVAFPNEVSFVKLTK